MVRRVSNPTPRCLWSVGAELGEGPVWLDGEQALYFVDIKGRRLHRCDGDGGKRHSWDTPQQPGFIVPRDDGRLVCGMQDGLYLFDPASGQFEHYAEVEPGQPGNRLNDGYVDQAGRLWFGSMHDGETDPTGALYRVDHHGAAITRHDDDYVITNGPAMSPDGLTLYHTDTLKKAVYAFDVGPHGALSRKRLFVSITDGGHPDGMAVDAEGHVWVALFGGARIERYSPAGALVQTVPFPCANITKLTFGGDDLRTAYVTTAWKGLSPQERAQQPLAGGLFSFRSEVPGLPQHPFSSGTAL